MKYLTKTEIADSLRVSTQTVNSWISSGNLKAVDVRRDGSTRPMYRINQKDLEDFLSGRDAKPTKKKAKRHAPAIKELI